MTAEIVELLRQGRTEDIWKSYCGFLDLSIEEFMAVQERLLLEQLHEVNRCELGRMLMQGQQPTSLEEFRDVVPLTDYTDYAPYMKEECVDMLPRAPYIWAHTSGRSGSYKMVPYTREMYERSGERIMSALLLSTARSRGDVRIQEKEVLVYNAPPPPYASGVALVSVSELFPFHFVPSISETEELTFHERLELSFQVALVTGIDILGSITAVLVKIGERFAQGAGGASLSRYLLHPKALYRLSRGLIRSRLAGRPMLPKDLWDVKGITCGGTDSSLYKGIIEDYWGVRPLELYASTETGGTAAVEAWSGNGLYFFPDVVFLEFIPEAEWSRNREDPSHRPATVLLDEVQPGQRYELVITSLHGGPFLRYRMRDLIRFVSLQDAENQIQLPAMYCVGRSDGLIDLVGFSGPIDESMVWTAIHKTDIPYEEWTIRKEVADGGPILHLYIELRENLSAAEVRERVHAQLKELNPFYADMEEMLEIVPLRVTVLSPGTFRRYFLERQAAGADLAHMKPPHMNPSDAIVNDLLRLSNP